MAANDRYLQRRGPYWHYVRRVPRRLARLDPRGQIRLSLDTEDLQTARVRRDALAEADQAYWQSLSEEGPGKVTPSQRDEIERRYRAARSHAASLGFDYMPIQALLKTETIEPLLERLAALEKRLSGPGPSAARDVEAILGGAQPPPVMISEAFRVYCEEIAVGERTGKSESQARVWLRTKRRAIAYFIDVVGDKPILQITRADALAFHSWWTARLKRNAGDGRRSTNTANRDLGNLRRLCAAYFDYIGEEDRANPFRNLSFRERTSTSSLPFENSFVRERILQPGIFSDINEEARYIIYALIETGCRPSEIANLLPEHIHLQAPVPFISVTATQDREIKSAASARDIPLLGVSLEAMKRAPGGFPKYRDRPDRLSNFLMKIFRRRQLLPSPRHRIYSFRHSFEKRMQEAGIDFGLRCVLMGHSASRPEYGDGGSLAYRQKEMQKIIHPFSHRLFDP